MTWTDERGRPPGQGACESGSSQHTRAAIGSAAMKLFETQGYDRTTVADIAQHAGVSERTVFRHFPSKRSILLDFERSLDEAFRDAIRASPPPTLTLDAVEHVLLSWAGVLQRQRSAVMRHRLIIEASEELSTYALESLESHTAHIEAELARVFAETVDKRRTARVDMDHQRSSRGRIFRVDEADLQGVHAASHPA